MNAIVKTIELTMTTSLWDSYIMPARRLHRSGGPQLVVQGELHPSTARLARRRRQPADADDLAVGVLLLELAAGVVIGAGARPQVLPHLNSRRLHSASSWSQYNTAGPGLHRSAQHPLLQRDDGTAVDVGCHLVTLHQDVKEIDRTRFGIATRLGLKDEEGLTGRDRDEPVDVELHGVPDGPELTQRGYPQVTPIRRGTPTT
jgi:hypothetical protein